MIFRRKNQIDISIENINDLPQDDDFSNLSSTNIKTVVKKNKFKNFFVESGKNIKDDFVSFFKNNYLAAKENKYLIWREFLAFFSIFIIIFTVVMATWPFSFSTINNYSSPLSNFYCYNGSMITLSIPGIIFLCFGVVYIALLITHFFLYKKLEINKYTKKTIGTSRRNKAFQVIKYLSWTMFSVGFLFLLILILVPPSTNQFSQSELDILNQVLGFVNPSLAEQKLPEDVKNELIKIMRVDPSNPNAFQIAFIAASNLDPYNATFAFYNVYYGGVSSLNTIGIVLLSIGSVFIGLSLFLFASKIINRFLSKDRINKLKLDKIQFNFGDVKENISSINNKLRGIYNTSQQKYNDFRNKDTFRKYKKRLVEEGRDTNPDKFTTDVTDEQTIRQQKEVENESLFSVLKSAYKAKVNEHNNAERYSNQDRNRMKHKKPEIAVPDEELDEIIDSLDIK